MATKNRLVNEMLDDIYPSVDVAGFTMDVSDILFHMDPVAYDSIVYEFIDDQVSLFCDDNNLKWDQVVQLYNGRSTTVSDYVEACIMDDSYPCIDDIKTEDE